MKWAKFCNSTFCSFVLTAHNSSAQLLRTILNTVVIMCCLCSFILCARALFRAHLLKEVMYGHYRSRLTDLSCCNHLLNPEFFPEDCEALSPLPEANFVDQRPDGVRQSVVLDDPRQRRPHHLRVNCERTGWSKGLIVWSHFLFMVFRMIIIFSCCLVQNTTVCPLRFFGIAVDWGLVERHGSSSGHRKLDGVGRSSAISRLLPEVQREWSLSVWNEERKFHFRSF